MLVGGRDGGRIRLVEETTGDDLLAVSLWGVDSREISGLLEVREGEALDASLDGVDYRLGRYLAEYRSLLRVGQADDVALIQARGQDSTAKAERAEGIRAASALLDAQRPLSEVAGMESQGQVGLGDGLSQTLGEGTQQVRVTHYFGARVPFGDGGGYDNPMACHGEMPDAGAAACAPQYCDRRFEIGGIEFVCKDTGALVGARNIDIFCVSLECWDWACTQLCPTFADWESVRWLTP